jgi:hypothetical protein
MASISRRADLDAAFNDLKKLVKEDIRNRNIGAKAERIDLSTFNDLPPWLETTAGKDLVCVADQVKYVAESCVHSALKEIDEKKGVEDTNATFASVDKGALECVLLRARLAHNCMVQAHAYLLSDIRHFKEARKKETLSPSP